MSHKEQVDFIWKVKELYPEYFKNKNVVDIGSLDVNGNNRIFFEDCDYVGVDIVEGKNVDVVMPGHKYHPEKKCDVVISTECLEHDPYSHATMINMFNILKPNGLMIITCATSGRKEHGPSPLIDGKPFYKNVSLDDVILVLNPFEDFKDFSLTTEIKSPILSDLRFYGIKED